MSVLTANERKVVYTAEVVNQGGREGTAESENEGLLLSLVPPDQTEDGHEGTNPEQLFAAAYGACFHAALDNVAEKAGFPLKGSTLTARVTLFEDHEGGYELGVELRASMPGIPRTRAEHILHQAHKTCPYSKATRGIDAELEIALFMRWPLKLPSHERISEPVFSCLISPSISDGLCGPFRDSLYSSSYY
jgi:Ohr subfamily peroxiredoxin